MKPPRPRASAGSALIVVDTNVLSELMRRTPEPRVLAWVSRQQPHVIVTTAVTVAEVRFGILRLPEGRRRSALLKAAEEVFTRFAKAVLPFDLEAAHRYADVVSAGERAGRTISGFDAQIAAICLTNHASLVTRNTQDFVGMGLELVNPWSDTT